MIEIRHLNLNKNFFRHAFLCFCSSYRHSPVFTNGIAHYSVWTRCSSLLSVNICRWALQELQIDKGPSWSWSYDTTSAISAYHQGLHEKLCKAEQDCFWGPGDRLRLLSKLRIWGPIKPLVSFHKCFISCAAEYPDNIYVIQSSGKHNQLMQQGVTC